MADKPKVIYFTAADRPTPYDRQVASAMNAKVQFRNLFKVPDDEKVDETVDGVCGIGTPVAYMGVQSASDAIAAYQTKIADERAAKPATPAQQSPAPIPAPAPASAPAAVAATAASTIA